MAEQNQGFGNQATADGSQGTKAEENAKGLLGAKTDVNANELQGMKTEAKPSGRKQRAKIRKQYRNDSPTTEIFHKLESHVPMQQIDGNGEQHVGADKLKAAGNEVHRA